MKYIQKLIVVVLILVIIQSCNTDNNTHNIPIVEGNNKLINLDSNYYLEANNVYTYIFDSLRPMNNTLIYDTLCYFNYLNSHVIQDVLLTIDSIFSKDEGLYMINNFKRHKNDDIGNIINNNYYKHLISSIDSVSIKGRFFLHYDNVFKPIQLLISAPMFNENYTKSLTYIVSYYYEVRDEILNIKVHGTYIYLEKENKNWKLVKYIYEENPLPH